LGLSITAVHDQNAAAKISLRFDRCPLLIGRDAAIADLHLPDRRVSRIHASIDLRDGQICVRDSGSLDGTFLGGTAVPSDQWVAAPDPCVLQIAHWRLSVSTCPLAEDFADAGGSGDEAATAYVGAAVRPAPQFVTPKLAVPSLQVARACAVFLASREQLLRTVREVLEGAPPVTRVGLVHEMLRVAPAIATDSAVRALMQQYGIALEPTLEEGALAALQELASWYVHDRGPLASASDALAFGRKIKAGVDDLLSGLVPLFGGLDRFEQQMALRTDTDAMPSSTHFPRTPRDAALRLFDWRDTSTSAVRGMRRDLVDLTMHQVAVLNGVMQGVKVLLDELAPATIEKAWRRGDAGQTLFGRVFGRVRAASRRWALYSKRHSDLADEENERFRVIFGPAFAAEYKQHGRVGALGSGSEVTKAKR
jgi:hypothetical protein